METCARQHEASGQAFWQEPVSLCAHLHNTSCVCFLGLSNGRSGQQVTFKTTEKPPLLETGLSQSHPFLPPFFLLGQLHTGGLMKEQNKTTP